MQNIIKVFFIGNIRDLPKNQIICHKCNGTTIGDYGQPFECEECMGTGSIPLFEILSNETKLSSSV